MSRLALVLAAAAAAVVASSAAPASAADLPVDVFTRGDGSVCVTYDDLSTACTSPVLP